MTVVLRRIVVLALQRRLLAASAIGASLLSSVAALILPKLYGRAVDQALHLLTQSHGSGAEPRRLLLITALLVVTTALARGLLTGLNGFVAEACSHKVALELRLQLFRQLQRLPFSFHDRTHSGELITRGIMDLDTIRDFIQGGMTQSLTLLLLVVFAAILMGATEPRMAALALAFAPVATFAQLRMGTPLCATWLKVQRTMSAITLAIQENLQGVRVVRAFVGKTFEVSKFDRMAKQLLREWIDHANLRIRTSTIVYTSFYSSMSLLLWYGGHDLMAHRITVGRLTEFIVYMTMLQAPIRQISLIASQASRTVSAGTRLFEILDLQPEIYDRPGALDLGVRAEVVRFERVGFAYEPGRPVLQDISFEVKAGRTVGIVGPPGSGKSTIANLIPRFYEATSGRITIDNQDVRSFTLDSLRTYVRLIRQEAFLFDETLHSNIAYVDPAAGAERVSGAARIAHIDGYIRSLPLRYESRAGERGVTLSGGQRQRLCVARGLISRPGLLVFDDSTAALDGITERRVQDAIVAVSDGCSVIIISHRLNTLMHADEILVLDAGRIVERGDHAALLRLGGVYAKLYSVQLHSSTR